MNVINVKGKSNSKWRQCMQENPAQTRLSWRLQEGGRLTLGATLTITMTIITMTTITLTIITIRTAIVTNKTLTKEHNYKDERSRIV